MAFITKPKLITPIKKHKEDDESRDVVGSHPGFSASRFFANLALDHGSRKRGALSAASQSLSVDEPMEEASLGRPRSNSSGSSLIVLRKASRPLAVEILGQLDGADDSYRQFLLTQQLYDMVPHVGKVVIFDQRLSIRRAFIAMVETGVRAAPVWDSDAGRPVSMLTHTDFLRMLSYSHSQGLKDPDLKSIQWWMSIGNADVALRPPTADRINMLSAFTNLLKVTEVLVSTGVHRLPILEPNTCEILSFVSLKTILRILHRQMGSLPVPAFMRIPLRAQQKIGTWGSIHTTRMEAQLSSAVELLLTHCVSGLPVVDGSGALVEVLTKADVISLLNDEAVEALKAPRTEPHLFKDLLQLTVAEAVERRGRPLKDLSSVSERDSLHRVVEGLCVSRLRALFVLDADSVPVGVISVTDVLQFILTLRRSPLSSATSASLPVQVHL